MLSYTYTAYLVRLQVPVLIIQEQKNKSSNNTWMNIHLSDVDLLTGG